MWMDVLWAEHPRGFGSSAPARDLPAPSLQTGRWRWLNRCPIKTSQTFEFTKQSLPCRFCPFLFGCGLQRPVLAAWLWAAVGAPSPPGDVMCSDCSSHLWNLVQMLVENWTSHGFWALNLLFLFVRSVKNVGFITCFPSCGFHCDFHAHQRFTQSKQPRV